MIPTSIRLNDLEQRNSPYFAFFSPNSIALLDPISITSLLLSTIERFVVEQYLYPAFFIFLRLALSLTNMHSGLLVQHCHSSKSSPTFLAVIHTTYVIVIALSFSKAFDTARQSTPLHKIAQLDLPDTVYNWLVNLFKDHQQYTRCDNGTSSLTEMSYIQGSVIGPASYIVNASDMKTLIPGNSLSKYVDDTSDAQ